MNKYVKICKVIDSWLVVMSLDLVKMTYLLAWKSEYKCAKTWTIVDHDKQVYIL